MFLSEHHNINVQCSASYKRQRRSWGTHTGAVFITSPDWLELSAFNQLYFCSWLPSKEARDHVGETSFQSEGDGCVTWASWTYVLSVDTTSLTFGCCWFCAAFVFVHVNDWGRQQVVGLPAAPPPRHASLDHTRPAHPLSLTPAPWQGSTIDTVFIEIPLVRSFSAPLSVDP